MPVSFHGTLADDVHRALAHAAGAAAARRCRRTDAASTFVELDPHDFLAIDAKRAAAAEAAALLELDDAAANGDELALHARAVAQDERVGGERDRERERERACKDEAAGR